jgi:branched-chain amino acid transport system substrate-binding protein
MIHTTRTLALLAALAVLATACGQKEGVHVSLQGGGQPAPVQDVAGDEFAADDLATDEFAADGFTADEFGDELADGTGSGEVEGGLPDPGTGAAPSGGQPQPQAPTGNQTQAQPPSGGGQQPPPPAGGEQPPPSGGEQPPANPNDTVGVGDDRLVVGVHAPLSGAAPLPQTEFERGRQQYWTHVGPVDGRQVQVEVRDDQYNPSRATSVCNELIQRTQVFVLIGGGGADQIAACARTAAQQGVPYLSAGVDEGNLRSLRNYFAMSMSYPQQAPLVAQMIDARYRPSDNRVAIVRDRTPSFNNAINRLQEELQARGLQPQVIQYTNGPGTAQAVSGFQVAFGIMAPSDFVQIVRSPGGMNPQWVGMGITMGLNTVSGTACQGGNPYKGTFLSPFPGLNVIDSLDPEFRRAGGQGDIELALWGLNKNLHEVLKKMGGTVTRSNFIRTLETNVIETNVYPTLRHTPDNHFGASTAHVLEANCGTGQYETKPGDTFVSGF